MLQETLKMNQIKNAKTYQLALSALSGTLELSNDGSCSTFHSRSSQVFTVPVTTLDLFVLEHHLNGIGLIKVDIEGDEQNFLLGAKETIYQNRPILMISIYHNIQDFLRIKPLIESWNLGYTFQIHKPFVEENIAAELLLIAEPNYDEL